MDNTDRNRYKWQTKWCMQKFPSSSISSWQLFFGFIDMTQNQIFLKSKQMIHSVSITLDHWENCVCKFSPWSLDKQSSVQFSSVQSLSCVWLFATPWTTAHQAGRCPSPTAGVHPNPCPLSWRCHPTISSSVVPFSSCPQYFPASQSFQMSQLFTWGGQSIGVSASTSVLPMNTQDWSPLGWTGWISLQSKGLSRVFSNNTVQKHQFFGAQLSL